MQTNVLIELATVALLSADATVANLPVRNVDGTDGILPVVRGFRAGRLEQSAIVCTCPRGDPVASRTNAGNRDWQLTILVQTAFNELSEPESGRDSDSDGVPDFLPSPLSVTALESRHSNRFTAVQQCLQSSDLLERINAGSAFTVQHVMWEPEDHRVSESHLVSQLSFRLLGVTLQNYE